MAVRKHESPQVTTIGQIRADLANRANNPGNTSVPPAMVTGPDDDATQTCPTCHGTGKVMPPTLSGDDTHPGE